MLPGLLADSARMHLTFALQPICRVLAHHMPEYKRPTPSVCTICISIAHDHMPLPLAEAHPNLIMQPFGQMMSGLPLSASHLFQLSEDVKRLQSDRLLGLARFPLVPPPCRLHRVDCHQRVRRQQRNDPSAGA